MKTIKIILAFTILSISFAVDKTGTTAAKFLSIGPGAKAIAMGGAFVSIADDATAMYWNPAGIINIKQSQILFSHTDWLIDINYDYIGFVTSMSPNASFGLNITAVTMGEMDVTRYNNEDTGETFKAGSWAFGVSFGSRLTDRFSIGFNGKFIREFIANSNASGLALDVGTLFETPFGFRLGASISNFGPKMQMSGVDLLYHIDIDANQQGDNESIVGEITTDKFDLPLLLRVGISDEIDFTSGMSCTWSIDANHPNDNTEYVNMGMQFSFLNNMIFLRGGSKTIFMKDREETYTVGGGFRYSISGFSELSVDYAYETWNFLGDTQTFTLALTF